MLGRWMVETVYIVCLTHMCARAWCVCVRDRERERERKDYMIASL